MMSFEETRNTFSATKRCEKTYSLRAIGSFFCPIKLCKRLFQQAESGLRSLFRAGRCCWSELKPASLWKSYVPERTKIADRRKGCLLRCCVGKVFSIQLSIYSKSRLMSLENNLSAAFCL